MNEDRHDYSDEERRLLAEMLQPLTLDEEAIQRTLRRAVESRARRRRLCHRWIAAIVVFGALLAARPWRWSGTRSSQDMDFAQRLRVIDDSVAYDLETVRLAMGITYDVVDRMLRRLELRRALSGPLREALVAAIDSPPRSGRHNFAGFEDLLWKTDNFVPLSAQEESMVVEAVAIAVSACRQLAARLPEHATYERIMRSRLRALAAGS